MPDSGSRLNNPQVNVPAQEDSLIAIKDKIEYLRAKLELEDLMTRISQVQSFPSNAPKAIPRDQIQEINPYQQQALMADYRNIKVQYDSNGHKIVDGNVMMEGPLDHVEGGSPSERFMNVYLDPYKIAVLCRFSEIGYRCTHETAADAWAGGLSLDLIGENLDEKEQDLNRQIKDHWKKNTFETTSQEATGAAEELGSSLIVYHYEGEFAAQIGTYLGSKVSDFGYLSTPVRELKNIVSMDAFSRLDFAVIEDDGRGHPIMFQVNLFLGYTSGLQTVNIHASRCTHIIREKIERGFDGTPRIQSCYNPMVIGSMAEKAIGEVAFRWAYGKPLILTKGLTDATLAQFKANLGNPTREAWFVLPSEWVEKFELLSNNAGNMDLPGYIDKMVDMCVIATGIPKAVMQGDVQGVNTENVVNNQNYFAVLGKIHKYLADPILDYFNKDLFMRKILQGYIYEYNWGIRFSMSAEDKVDLETKEVANDVTRLQYMTYDEIRAKNDLPKLKEVIENEFKEYASKIGNSIAAFTIPQQEQVEAQIQSQIEVAKIKAESKQTMGKTVLGNSGKGKGKGVGHGEGLEKQRIKQPKNLQTAKAQAISRVKNEIKNTIKYMRDELKISLPEVAKAFGTNKDKIREWEEYKDLEVQKSD